MGATHGAGTAYTSESHELTSGFQWGSCCSIFNLLCSVLHLVFVLFRLPLYCLFIDLRIMITPLVSSPNNRPVKIIVDI